MEIPSLVGFEGLPKHRTTREFKQLFNCQVIIPIYRHAGGTGPVGGQYTVIVPEPPVLTTAPDPVVGGAVVVAPATGATVTGALITGCCMTVG